MSVDLIRAKFISDAVNEKLHVSAMLAGVYVQKFVRAVLVHLSEFAQYSHALFFVQSSRSDIIELGVAARAIYRY